MDNEKTLNQYFNKGKYNYPEKIGYVMSEIRKQKPMTIGEWRTFYFNKVRSISHIENLAQQMHRDIPPSFNIKIEECITYFQDVIIRRTFEGFNKEKQALKILRKEISYAVQESPKEWDGEYFIDFYIKTNDLLIGIQLKPDTFYIGKYFDKVNIEAKLKAFREKYKASTFTLIYKKSNSIDIHFINPEVIDAIRGMFK